MGDELHEFKYTEDRAEIMRELAGLASEAARVADVILKKGYPEDADKTRNIAQAAASRRSLMAQAFEAEDKRPASG